MVRSGCYRFLISLFSAELPGIRIGLGRGQGSPSEQGGGGWLPFLEAAPAWTLQQRLRNGLRFQASAYRQAQLSSLAHSPTQIPADLG